MSGYLSLNVDHVRAAWNACAADSQVMERQSANAELGHARRIVAVHVPQDWPHGLVCRNCHGYFPCAPAQWAFGVLKALRWELADLFDLLELTEVMAR